MADGLTNGTPAGVVEGFLYDGQLRPVAWLDGTGAVKATFVYATHVNVPEYMSSGGKNYRILTDHLGSPRLVVDTTSGAVMQRMDYDSFGQVLADSAGQDRGAGSDAATPGWRSPGLRSAGTARPLS